MTQTVQPYSVQSFKQQLTRVGDAVKNARQARGMTQSELAALLGINSKTISAIEVSRVEPSVTQIQAIAASLGEPVGYFLGEASSTIEAKIDHVAEELNEIRKLIQLIEAQKQVKADFDESTFYPNDGQ